jgi:arylsulfatase A-like enzyme
MVSQIDLFPTVCELLDIEPPAWLQGRSVLPLVTGDAGEVNDAVFAEVSYHAAYEPQRCVRTRRYKYIRRFLDRETPVVCNTDGGPSRKEWMDAGYAGRRLDREQLYDLVFDLNEAHNLVGTTGCEAALEEMWRRLRNWMEETDDPLLKGDVPAPAGAMVNEQDAHSSRDKPRMVEG